MNKKNKRAKKLMSDLPKGFSCTVGSDKDCWYRAQCILEPYYACDLDYCDTSILVHDALRSFVKCGVLDESYVRELRRWEKQFRDDDWLVERLKAECDILRDDLGC